jgi:cullin 3
MAAPKKFVIKSFRNQNVMDSSGAQKTWSTLEAAIDEIYNQNASALSFEELYRSAYNLVLNKFGDLLYTGVANAVKRHLQEAILVVVETPKDKLHAAISKAWNDHKITMNMVKDILMYMDRTYAVEHKKAPVYNMSILIFREVVVYHTEVRERMRALLLENIENERNGYLIDKDLMKGLLTMLGELSVDGANVYEEEFEKHFLDMTRAFYRHESQSYLSESNCSDFIRKADARLTEEAVRVRQYLSAATEPKLKHLMEYEYISTHAQALVEMETSGCQYMFKEDKLEDLKMMYNLFSRVPSTLDFIRDSLSEYVKKAGLEIVADQETVRDPIQFVQRMLELKEKFDKIIKESFRDDKKFLKRLKEAFESFINKDTRCAAHLASYVDDLLKSGLKGMSESDVEAHLDRVIVLFHYLSDKDIFEDMYRNHLTKRLLNNRSVSDDTEKLMISKLKSECGQQFTSKMEGMFLDMNMSKEIMEAYKGM